jgi:hypothetical protein
VQLVARRLPSHAAHVTAFVASHGAPASLAGSATAAELRQRYQAAGVVLDVALLCPRSELAAPALAALEALTGGCGDSEGLQGEGAAEPAGVGSGCGRLVWLSPVPSAAESWQQLEPALEQLEGSRGAAAAAGRPCEGSSGSGSEGGGGGADAAAVPPQRISRAPQVFDPLRHPRAPLLALRSGVQQPALCRGESLSRLGHLSSDGMARPWLPTYSSLARQAEAAGRAGGGGGAVAGAAADPGMVYVEVQPIPRWRTLLKAAAGRMQAAPPGSGRDGVGGFAAASSDLLRSLDALSAFPDDEEESEPARQAGGGAASSVGGGGEFSPDPRRGTLRLLQATKEPEQLKLVWSAERETAAGGGGGEAAPLDLFAGGDGPAGGGGSVPGPISSVPGPSASRSALLSYMPAAAVAAAAARGPLLHEGAELWEAAAEWEWELNLSTQAAAGGGDSGGAAPAEVEARQAANGGQLLLVAPRGRGRRRPPAPPAVFWLQQRLCGDDLQPPAYAMLADVSSAPASPPAGSSAADESPQPQPQPQAQPLQAAPLDQAAPALDQEASGGGDAARLAAALLRTLRSPPAVDVRRLRRDVKAGTIQVRPCCVPQAPCSLLLLPHFLLGDRTLCMR